MELDLFDAMHLGVAAWIVAVVVLFHVRRRLGIQGSGLLYAHVLTLASIHWLAPAIYLLPATPQRDLELVAAGLTESTYAILALVAGSLTASALFARRPTAGAAPRPVEPALALWYVGAGGAAYLLQMVPQLRLPTLFAVILAAQQLLVVGLCLLCWQAWRTGRTTRLLAVMSGTLGLPFLTIVQSGYMSYGAVAALVVFVFVANLARVRWKVLALGLVVVYVGMSFYVSYMRDRGEIRETVWRGRPLTERVGQLADTVMTFEWFNVAEPVHLQLVDVRLNQNFLVGAAVTRMVHTGDFAYGGTMLDGVLVLIPRVIWPDKPTGAGSGDLVSQYTGLRFQADTSVGIGQVMEFYVNFGSAGVVAGFFLLGALMTWLDRGARRCLDHDDWLRFARWFVVGLSLMQTGGSLVDVVGGAAAGLVAVLIANQIYGRYLRVPPVALPLPRPSASAR